MALKCIRQNKWFLLEKGKYLSSIKGIHLDSLALMNITMIKERYSGIQNDDCI